MVKSILTKTFDLQALEPVLPFVDDASNWYVRRSRRRFWKSGDDANDQGTFKALPQADDEGA